MKTHELGIPFVQKVSPRARSIKIHIASDGTVIVTTPPRFPRARIPVFVEEARAWIVTHQQRMASKPVLWSTTSLYYFGLQHKLINTGKLDGSVHVLDGKIYVAPLTGTDQALHDLLENWLKHRAIEYCLPRIEWLAKKMETTYRDVRFKAQKTCWGSCSMDKNLNFNWRLIHAPQEVIDYVIIHELAHTKHMNHGSGFWDLVARHDPDHPLHRGWLKRYGSTED